MKSRLDKRVWVLFFFFSPGERERVAALCVVYLNVATPACRVHLRQPVQTLDVQTQPEQPKETFFRSQITPVQASVTQNLSGGTQSKKIFVFFFFSFFYFCHVGIPDYILWHCTVTQPVSPASPLCSHALIMIVYGCIVLFFISWSGASICFLGSFLIFCAFILKTVLIGLCIRRAGECVFAL